MKKTLFLLVGLLLCLSSLQAVSLFLDFARFQNQEAKPYMEVYITIDGTSVSYKPLDAMAGFQAKVEIEVQLLRLEESGDTSIQFIDKYNLLSPVIQDTNMESRKAFPDLKRIMTPPGLYALRVIARDVYTDVQTDHLTVIEVGAGKADEFAYSDIEFIAGIKPTITANVFTKHSNDIIPFGLDGTFINQDSLQFYVELYNTDKAFDQKYFAQASLYVGDQQLFEHTYTTKKEPSAIDIFSGGFRIADLAPSIGSPYSLHIKIFNKDNKTLPELVERVYIYSEDMLSHLPVANQNAMFDNMSDDQVRYYIGTLIYLTDYEDEIRLAKSLRSPEERKNYLAGFWEKRSLAEERSANILWETHRFAVKYANENFKSNFEEGWKTDRGRAFIKYGPPSDIERFPNDRNYLPYELWKYDKLGTQAQVVFIFCDTDRSTESYSQIHSTKYGELQNPTWRSALLQPSAGNQGARLNDFNVDSGERVPYESDSRTRTNIGGSGGN